MNPKEDFIDFIAGLVAFYIFISFWAIIIGMISTQKLCDQPSTRIGRVIPAYKFGCWLTEVPK